MRGKHLILSAIVAAALLCAAVPGFAVTTPILGTAQDFAVLGHMGVSNTGPTVVFGSAITLANVGNYQDPGANAISGFSIAGNSFVGTGAFTDGPGLVNAPAAIYGKDAVSLQARNDLINAYTALALLAATDDMTGEDLGNYNGGNLGALAPGVYEFNDSVGITGTLELDAGGVDGVFWVFQIGSTLTTASASAVKLINPGGNLGADVGVFWVVGSSATLGTTTAFEGNILALTDITLTTGATIYNGRALARNGAVTLDTNVISDICPSASETGTALATAIANEILLGITPTNSNPGLGSSSPNSGPGFSGGLLYDTETGRAVLPGGGPLPVVPEPITLGGLVLGLGTLCGYIRRRKCAAGGS
jgi:hypothetical protein